MDDFVIAPENGAVVVSARTRMFENARRHFEVPVDARVIETRMVDDVRLVTSALVPVPFAAVSHVAANAPATGPTVSAMAGNRCRTRTHSGP